MSKWRPQNQANANTEIQLSPTCFERRSNVRHSNAKVLWKSKMCHLKIKQIMKKRTIQDETKEREMNRYLYQASYMTLNSVPISHRLKSAHSEERCLEYYERSL